MFKNVWWSRHSRCWYVICSLSFFPLVSFVSSLLFFTSLTSPLFFSFLLLIYIHQDAIHAADGREYILEVNDTAIGLGPEDEEEDNGYIRDLVLEKLRSLEGTSLFR